MKVAFTFRAKPGKEKEFERLMNNPEGGRLFGRHLGMSRNTLFLGNGRMIRVVEFPEDAPRPPSMLEIAAKEPAVMEFLRRLGPIVEPGFDVDRPETFRGVQQGDHGPARVRPRVLRLAPS